MASKLAPLLDEREEELIKQLARRDTGFVYLARRIPQSRANRVKRLKIEGLEFIPEFKRIYPRDWMASQLLGVTGTDNQGLSGLEYSLDKYLHGRDGERKLTKDALGDAIQQRDDDADRPGTERAADARRRDPGPRRAGARGGRRDAQAQGRDRDRDGPARRRDPRARELAAGRRQPRPATRPTTRARTARSAPPTSRARRSRRSRSAGALEEGRVTPDTTFNLAPTIKVADREIGEAHDGRLPHADHSADPQGVQQRRRGHDRPAARRRRTSTSGCAASGSASRPASTCRARSRASCSTSRTTPAPRWATCRSARASP